MQGLVEVTGMVLKQMPVGEYDRRVCLLTKDRGKIWAFARGSRRQGNHLCGATNPFSFGCFKLFAGRDSYTIQEADIQNYFAPLREDFVAAYMGMYFTEVCDYYTRENNDEKEVLKLLYQSLRALTAPSLKNELVQAVFELKIIMVNGEFPGLEQYPSDIASLEESTRYAVDFIQRSPVEHLYTFTVTEGVLRELREISTYFIKKITNTDFKSLEILKTLG